MRMTATWSFATKAIQGGRDYQEDECTVRPLTLADGSTAVLAVLADGMGGHAGGAVASEVAVRSFTDAFVGARGETAARLESGLQAANDAVAATSDTDPGLSGMGCTVVGLLATADRLEWISVGDSPLWIFSGGRLRRLNEDHSMMPLLLARVQRGDMTAEAASVHPARNALRSAVVGEDIPLVDLASMPMRPDPNEVVVLASDGLCSLSDREIESVLQQNTGAAPDGLARRLIEAVDRLGLPDQDNTTVIVLRLAVD